MVAIIFFVIFCIVQIIAFLNFFAFEAGWFVFGARPPEANFMFFQFGILFLFITVMLGIGEISKKTLKDAVQNTNEAVDRLARKIPNTRALLQDDFYTEFRKKVGSALKTVDMTHLDTASPQSYALSNTITGEYYANFADMVRKKTDVDFRRVERVSVEKKDWIERIVRELGGQVNFSLSVLTPDDPTEKLPHISVQIIDGKDVFLVAVAMHKTSHNFRDMSITDERSAEIWRNYYDNTLWEKSERVIDRGKINEVNLKRVRELMS